MHKQLLADAILILYAHTYLRLQFCSNRKLKNKIHGLGEADLHFGKGLKLGANIELKANRRYIQDRPTAPYKATRLAFNLHAIEWS